ncbi:cyclic nucleotide-gated ion channel 1-like [Pyrus ussuriensis x Pyrus communis]|uniref:Cyclic nucleotide-gated ion channel 1-like n=1 Tax=Pyrus ussuriensis x Pyrus communis TaxID=2448454 RepID=A0A5N5GZY5_9ROSA|nr:cyclic nucleotide-gated ion channel 1-like [Pyrus ussuriensis x Pyrus communis]
MSRNRAGLSEPDRVRELGSGNRREKEEEEVKRERERRGRGSGGVVKMEEERRWWGGEGRLGMEGPREEWVGLRSHGRFRKFWWHLSKEMSNSGDPQAEQSELLTASSIQATWHRRRPRRAFANLARVVATEGITTASHDTME